MADESEGNLNENAGGMNPTETFAAFQRHIHELRLRGEAKAIDEYFDEVLRTYSPWNRAKQDINTGTPDSRDWKSWDVMYASMLNEAADWNRSMGRPDTAEIHFKRALAILKADGLDNTSHYAHILINLAGFYRFSNRFEDANKMFAEALTILQNLPETDCYAMASIMNNVAYNAFRHGDLAGAAETCRKVREYVDKCASKESRETAVALVNTASIQNACNDLEHAESTATVAIQMLEASGKLDATYAHALDVLAQVKYKQEDFKSALSIRNRILPLVEELYGRKIEYAEAEEQLAHALDALGEMSEAFAHAESAYHVISSSLPPDNPRVTEYREYRDLLESFSF